jgi:tRNA A-37 threonylcarbamoyl transferase component Bud32
MSAPKYREEFLLGTGGMAEVWRAVGPLGAVAIKRLLPHAARNPSLAAAFEREGRLLQRIRHPNVIGIHEVTRDDRGTSLVLEYVDGTDLRALAGQPVPERMALRVMCDVLRALEAVHGLCDEAGRPLGLIHRDLSPSNVLVGATGKVKLTDFGIARAVRGTHATTGVNVKGTLAYLAPEQANGAPVDARADLFAAGALLYEMLCGKPIYDEADPRLALARARAGDVKSLSVTRPETPWPIVELVDRALSANPTDRFPDAPMMLSEVERVAEQTCGLATDEELAAWSRSLSISAGRGDPVTAAASMTTLVQRRPSSRRRMAALGVLMILAAGLWLGVRAARRSEVARSTARAQAEFPAPVPVAEAAPAAAPPTPSAEPTPLAEADRPPGDDTSTSKLHGPARTRRPLPSDGRTGTPAESHAPLPTEARTMTKTTAVENSGQKCLLDIGSEPAFAYVSIDGIKVGPTPLFGREVTPGTHQIQVSRDGLGSKSFTIEVRPGDRISRVVKLP